jgi:hypothetical protein
MPSGRQENDEMQKPYRDEAKQASLEMTRERQEGDPKMNGCCFDFFGGQIDDSTADMKKNKSSDEMDVMDDDPKASSTSNPVGTE